jgi:hypothetical protein
MSRQEFEALIESLDRDRVLAETLKTAAITAQTPEAVTEMPWSVCTTLSPVHAISLAGHVTALVPLCCGRSTVSPGPPSPPPPQPLNDPNNASSTAQAPRLPTKLMMTPLVLPGDARVCRSLISMAAGKPEHRGGARPTC